jgi:hypothetical protein
LLLPLLQELFFALFMSGIGYAAIHRADFGALGLGEPAHALSAFAVVYDVDRVSFFDSLILAFRLAGAATDAIIGDLVCHSDLLRLLTAIFGRLFYTISGY